MVPQTTWLYVTCGAFLGGLAIKFIGFRDSDTRHKGFSRFVTACFWLQTGVTVTTVTTHLLKFTEISLLFEKSRTLALILSIIGLIKLYPPVKTVESNCCAYYSNWIHWILFWQMPSIYFSTFDYNTLEQSALCCYIMSLTCFTIGAIIPLHNSVVYDLGMKIASGSIFYFISGLTMRLALILIPDVDWFSTPALINSSLLILTSGLFIDDVQHIKVQFETADSQESADVMASYKDTARKSLPLFIETVFAFGRIAAILDSNTASEIVTSYEVQTYILSD